MSNEQDGVQWPSTTWPTWRSPSRPRGRNGFQTTFPLLAGAILVLWSERATGRSREGGEARTRARTRTRTRTSARPRRTWGRMDSCRPDSADSYDVTGNGLRPARRQGLGQGCGVGRTRRTLVSQVADGLVPIRQLAVMPFCYSWDLVPASRRARCDLADAANLT